MVHTFCLAHQCGLAAKTQAEAVGNRLSDHCHVINMQYLRSLGPRTRTNCQNVSSEKRWELCNYPSKEKSHQIEAKFLHGQWWKSLENTVRKSGEHWRTSREQKENIKAKVEKVLAHTTFLGLLRVNLSPLSSCRVAILIWELYIADYLQELSSIWQNPLHDILQWPT